ncbi:MAG: M1 family metallopeptidase [Crocinitomicaceae bacterium]|nr:M1 family metallopeptidase [Crocinitomicaceae bacterium]
MIKNTALAFLFSTATLAASAQNYFQQEVNYTITVALNDQNHTLSGFEKFEYTNNSGLALDFLYIHIWPNAYRDNKTALAKQLYNMNDMGLEFASDDDKGYIDSLNFQVNGEDVKWEYDAEHPDICKVNLNAVLKPGETIVVTTPFKVKIPSGDISRLGHVGESYQITQWYPKPAVFDQNGWHQMPYLTQGEFYSEYGSFDVSITVPENYVVGATGDLRTESEIRFLDSLAKRTEEKYKNGEFKDRKTMTGGSTDFPESSEKMKTIRFTQKNVHDFAWFADKRFEVLKGEVELPHSHRKVTTWAMFVTHHHALWKDALEYLHDGTYYYSLWNGDYPYNNVTAVDGTISAGGGMEYPNITVIGNAGSKEELEIVIVHEVGHNWFYGQLGSNERDHGWMDEGLNTLNEIRYIETKYPKNQRLSDMMMGMADKVHLEHLSHHDLNDITYSMSACYGLDQPIELPSADYSMINYGAIVYSKTGLVFTYLRDYLGDAMFDSCMQAYYAEWEFKHPQPQDLKNAFEKTSGKDLSWLFSDIIPTTGQIDFELKKVKMENGNTVVTVKNTGQVDGPVRVDAISGGKIRSTLWAEPGSKKSTITFEGTNYDKISIDSEQRMPELNRNNNTWKKDGLFHKVEPVKMEFLGGDNEPQYSMAWYTPIMGANVYDKFMIGVLFHNQTLPKNKFEYTVAPMFSIGRKNLSGFANFNYSWVPANNFKMITLGVNTKTFGNGLGVQQDSLADKNYMYFTVQPYLDMRIGKSAKRVFYKQRLKIHGTYINEQGDLYQNQTINGSVNYLFSYAKRIHNVQVGLRGDFFNNTTSYGGADSLSSILNAHVELKYNITYWKKKKEKIEIRVYLGKNLMYTGGYNTRYGFALGGQSGTMDAAYEYYMMGRNEASGLWSQQRIDNQGGFRTVSWLGTTNQMMFTTNIFIDLPYIPLAGIFADFGVFEDNAGNMDEVYDVGVGFRMADRFGIYFPIYESDNLKNSFATDIKYYQKIRFVLNLNGINSSEIIQSVF